MFCFVREDLINSTNNPLVLQANYANQCNELCLLSIDQKKLVDKFGNQMPILNSPVFLRTTCTNFYNACNLLKILGIKTIETINDYNVIEDWFNYIDVKRKIIEITKSKLDLYEERFNICRMLVNFDKLFIKSKEKNFSLIISVADFLDCGKLKCFFNEHCKEHDELLISGCYKIGRDSLGNKESRSVVLNGKIINSSRKIPFLKHTVPKSQIRYANEMVKKISQVKKFPQNYILDIGEFIDISSEEKFYDIIEINPISTSICYVNNSVFVNSISDEITKIHESIGFGYEFCLDYSNTPNNYSLERVYGTSYEYFDEGRFEIL